MSRDVGELREGNCSSLPEWNGGVFLASAVNISKGI